MKINLKLTLPRAPSAVRTGAIIAMVLLLLLFAGSVWWDFPFNGNPVTWLSAKDAYLDGVRLRNRYALPAAVDRFEKSIAVYPNDANFQFALGESLEKLGRFAEAEKAFNAAIKLNPNYIDAWLHLSDVQHRQGNMQASEKSCRQALQIDPHHSEALAQMALILFAQNKTDEAKKLFDSSVARPKPDTSRFWFLAAQCYDAENNDKKARACFARAARSARIEPEYAETLGMWLCDHKHDRDALYWLRVAATISPGTAKYSENYGLVLARAGSGIDGLQYLKNACVQQPDNLQYNKNYVAVMHDVGMFDDAIAHLHKLIVRKQADDDCWLMLMDCLMQKKNYGQIKTLLTGLINEASGTDKAVAARYLGDVCKLQGNPQDATAAYQQALCLGAQGNLKDYLEKSLSELSGRQSKAPTASR